MINIREAIFKEGVARAGDRVLSSLYDEIFESMKWQDALPYLNFPSTWWVKIIPPFVGAIVRFKVRKASTPEDQYVSIYFDGYNNLGHASGPYWEVYPGSDGDTARFLLGDEKDMMIEIEGALQSLEEASA